MVHVKDFGPLPSTGAMVKPDLDDTTLTHVYRAVVGHADVWRERMDATTNWHAPREAPG